MGKGEQKDNKNRFYEVNSNKNERNHGKRF